MSAREELLDEYGRADTAPLGTPAELRAKLDAYRAEVLREAAQMIRDIGIEPFEGMNEGAKLIRGTRALTADYIDPDVELDTAP